MAVRNVFMKNFPVVSVEVYEGTLTRYTGSVSPTGGINEGVAVYSAPVVKGDFVKLKNHTTNGIILVELAGVAAAYMHGVAVSDPMGIDNTTVSGQTPVTGLRRIVDVAFFGLGIIEMTVSETGAVAPGDIVGIDENEVNEIETLVAYASIDIEDNTGFLSLGYGVAKASVPVLIGGVCFVDNT
jgi:hypothetical protein